MKGKFQLLVKCYAEWGQKAHPHTYRPPGAVSNHLFDLAPFHVPIAAPRAYWLRQPFLQVRALKFNLTTLSLNVTWPPPPSPPP